MSHVLRSAARLGLAVMVSAGFFAVTATPAHAAPPVATLTMSGEMHYEAALNQANNVRITIAAPGVYQFMDNYPITFSTPDGSTCWYPYPPSQTIVHCEHSASFLDVKTYDLNDTIDNRTTSNMHAFGGDGNDTIRLGGHVTAAAAGDAAGEAGDDLIYSGPGDDWISGGSGNDTVSYVGRTAAVTASLTAGGGGDPATDEEDVYLGGTIENLTGGGAGDTLTGNGSNNVLDGGYYTTPCPLTPGPLLSTNAVLAPPPCTTYSGDDTIDGAGGNDTLRGRQGADSLLGGPGNDVMYGDAGYDYLFGGTGTNVCYPGADGALSLNCTLA
ncbi:calcium-binding protein [Dactylosporangium sucinum]|nr:calcium-binding protein [Dactylosporangium sucinum]